MQTIVYIRLNKFIGLFAVKEAPIPNWHHSFHKVHAFSGVVCTMPDLLRSAFSGGVRFNPVETAMRKDYSKIYVCLHARMQHKLVTEALPLTHFSGKSRYEPYISSIWNAFSLLWKAGCLHYGKKVHCSLFTHFHSPNFQSWASYYFHPLSNCGNQNFQCT